MKYLKIIIRELWKNCMLDENMSHGKKWIKKWIYISFSKSAKKRVILPVKLETVTYLVVKLPRLIIFFRPTWKSKKSLEITVRNM